MPGKIPIQDWCDGCILYYVTVGGLPKGSLPALLASGHQNINTTQWSKLFSNEEMVYYAQCCCCFKSKTGAKIISILGLIFSSLTLIANIIGLAINPQAWVLKIGIRLAVSVNSLTAEVIYLGYALVTIGQIGYLAMFAMLFHGIKKERHGFMLPFLLFDMISLVVSYFKNF